MQRSNPKTKSMAEQGRIRLNENEFYTGESLMRGLNRFRLVIYGRQRTSLPSPVTLHYSPQAQALHTHPLKRTSNPSRILHLHSHRSY